MVIVGGFVIGALAYLIRGNAALARHRLERRAVGQRPRHGALDPGDHLDHRSRRLADRPADRDPDPPVRAAPAPESLRRALPRARVRRRQARHERHQGPGRSRAADAQPDRRDARPVVPQRALLHRGVVLRRARADPGARAQRSRARAARRHRRRDRGRRGVEPRPARRPLGLRRRRRPHARLGLVRALRDRVRRPSPALRRACRAGTFRSAARHAGTRVRPPKV